MHLADAGSDAYDCDFALNLLSHAQDGLYEIDQALRRIESGTYGICEMSGQPIPHERLEAIPWARFTVECQSQIEKENKALGLSRRVMPPALIENEEAEEQ
jgi:RNA polymerase-binding transcription factor DksA